MFMISSYQLGKEQFNFVCVCARARVCLHAGLSKTLLQDNLSHCFPILIMVGERQAVNLLVVVFPEISFFLMGFVDEIRKFLFL
jgi:hypothetical protein